MNAEAIGPVDTDAFGGMLGSSATMQELFRALRLIAPTELSVLIEGETGTGKELVAETLHRSSLRADGPFEVFDCSAVAPTLIEAELFGHERGAYTGAIGARTGLFEQANGGTLMLDELGELPKALQPKLLRVLEKREVRRLGGARSIAVDIRLISATNRSLREQVRRGQFREDLYFRVAGAHVVVPPLRERLEDLPLLVHKFLRQSDANATLASVPEHAWQIFRRHTWPGNVRELKHAVQRLAISPERPLALDDPLRHDDAPASTVALCPLRVARRKAIERFEREYLTELLRRAGGNITTAADIAQVSRQAIHLLMTKHSS